MRFLAFWSGSTDFTSFSNTKYQAKSSRTQNIPKTDGPSGVGESVVHLADSTEARAKQSSTLPRHHINDQRQPLLALLDACLSIDKRLELLDLIEDRLNTYPEALLVFDEA